MHICMGICTDADTDTDTDPLTCSSRLDADWLEASIESRGVDDVRVKVAVVLPVDEQRDDGGDDQAHDDSDHDAHVERHVIRTGGRWGERGREDTL